VLSRPAPGSGRESPAQSWRGPVEPARALHPQPVGDGLGLASERGVVIGVPLGRNRDVDVPADHQGHHKPEQQRSSDKAAGEPDERASHNQGVRGAVAGFGASVGFGRAGVGLGDDTPRPRERFSRAMTMPR